MKKAYGKYGKQILLSLVEINDSVKNNYLWGRLFEEGKISAIEDADLIKKILTFKDTRVILSSFTRYILKQEHLIEYADLIIEIGLQIIEKSDARTSYFEGIDENISNLIITLYDITSSSRLENSKKTAQACLDVWDRMYECNIGLARRFTREMMSV